MRVSPHASFALEGLTLCAEQGNGYSQVRLPLVVAPVREVHGERLWPSTTAHHPLQRGAHLGGRRRGSVGGLVVRSVPVLVHQGHLQLGQHAVVLQPPCPATRADGLSVRRLQVRPGYGGALEEGLGGHATGSGRQESSRHGLRWLGCSLHDGVQQGVCRGA